MARNLALREGSSLIDRVAQGPRHRVERPWLMRDPILIIITVAGSRFVLGLIALLKCRREDIPEVLRAFASWWKFWFRT
jgi:hypothetical protein